MFRRINYGMIMIIGLSYFQCASVINGSTQKTMIASEPQGAKVSVDGEYVGQTPLNLELKRKHDHTIRIEKTGYEPQQKHVKHRISGVVWGNALFGYFGIPGVIVDALSGGMYKLDTEKHTALLSKNNGIVAVIQETTEPVRENVSCSNCGHDNLWKNKFCIECGNSLQDEKDAVNLAEQEKVRLESERLERERLENAGMLEERRVRRVADTQIILPEKSDTPVMKKTEVKQQKPYEPMYPEPMDPHRLFIVPVADVLSSMEINTGGGTIFGVRKTEKRPFLGHLRLGLGGIAEIEISTTGIINQLSEGSPSIPTAAFKLQFFPESDKRPSFAGALRSSLWHSEIRTDSNLETWKFEKRIATLYFVASKNFGKIGIHSGLSINDLRIRSFTSSDTPHSPTETEIKDTDKDYFNKNILSPFVGIKVEANPRTRLMLEFERVPKYRFDVDNPNLSKDNITSEWMIISGIRFYILNWMSLDTGVMYRGDFHGIGDAQIDAGIDINLPVAKLVKRKR